MFDGIFVPFQLFSSEEPFFSFASKPPLDCQFIAHPVVTEKSSAFGVPQELIRIIANDIQKQYFKLTIIFIIYYFFNLKS
jgi:hypothetical protein